MDEFIYIQYSRAYRFDDVYNTCIILYLWSLHFNFRGRSKQPPRVRPSILWLVKGLIGFPIPYFCLWYLKKEKAETRCLKKGRRGIPRWSTRYTWVDRQQLDVYGVIRAQIDIERSLIRSCKYFRVDRFFKFFSRVTPLSEIWCLNMWVHADFCNRALT